MKRIDLSGQRFGRLTAISFAGTDKSWKAKWLCKCDCGNEVIKYTVYLRGGDTKSCGCYHIDKARSDSTTHGLSKSPEYAVHRSMIARCHNKNNNAYKHYGARGISVCNRWRFGENGISGFECFIEDMGRRPKPRLTIERKDNNLGYSKDNCVWATYTEQARNKTHGWSKRVRNALGQFD